MIQAKFSQKFGLIESEVEIHIEGHTESLICSAVSAITYTMLGVLENYKVDGWNIEFEDKDGDMYCLITGITEENNVRLNTILEAWYIGLSQIQLKHPDKIKIITEE